MAAHGASPPPAAPPAATQSCALVAARVAGSSGARDPSGVAPAGQVAPQIGRAGWWFRHRVVVPDRGPRMFRADAPALRAALLASPAGCTPPLSTEERAIIGGTRSIGASATMMLVGYPPDRSVSHTGTAVLIAPGVLLTAAHCIDAPTHPNDSYGVFTGDDASPYPRLVDLEPHLEGVAQVYPHPSYASTLPFYADIGVAAGHRRRSPRAGARRPRRSGAPSRCSRSR